MFGLTTPRLPWRRVGDRCVRPIMEAVCACVATMRFEDRDVLTEPLVSDVSRRISACSSPSVRVTRA